MRGVDTVKRSWGDQRFGGGRVGIFILTAACEEVFARAWFCEWIWGAM